MARINIEDSIYKDDRFIKLIIKFNSVDTAIGSLVRAWSLAQKHYLNIDNDRLIPLNEWKKQSISDLIIEVGLAEIRDKGVYVDGSKEQFGWLIQRSDAGKAPKLKKHDESSNQNKEQYDSTTDNDRLTDVNGSKPLTLTPSLPLSPFSNSSSSSDYNNITKTPRKRKAPESDEKRSLNSKTWDSYKSAYFNRYKVDPVRNGTVNSIISKIAERLGGESIDVVKFYLTHNDSFYLKNLHSIGLCLKDCESLRTQMVRGRAITSNDVRNFEKQQNTMDLIKAIQDGENF